MTPGPEMVSLIASVTGRDSFSVSTMTETESAESVTLTVSGTIYVMTPMTDSERLSVTRTPSVRALWCW